MEKILQIPLFRLFSLSVLRRFQGLIKRGPSVPSKLRQRIPGSQKHPRNCKGGGGERFLESRVTNFGLSSRLASVVLKSLIVAQVLHSACTHTISGLKSFHFRFP